MNFKPKFEKTKEVGSSALREYEPINKYMVKDLITFTSDTEITTVIDTFLEKRISGAPVLNQNKEIIGVIDDKDCLQTLVDSFYHNEPIRKRLVSAYMSDVYKTIRVDADIVDAANEFLKSTYKRLLVVDSDGKLKGQITRSNILMAIKDVNRTSWKKQN